MLSDRGELSAWDAIKWFLRITILSVIFVVFALAAAQFIEVEYDSKKIRADALAARLLYTDAFFVSGKFEESLFTEERLRSRFDFEEIASPHMARTAARITFESADGSVSELFIHEESYRFHIGTYLSGRAAQYSSVQTPIETTGGEIGHYRVEVVSG